MKKQIKLLLIAMMLLTVTFMSGCGKKEAASENTDANAGSSQEAVGDNNISEDEVAENDLASASQQVKNGVKATIEIKDFGTINLVLDPSQAPETVDNFVKLANEGFYDGLTFHRIIEGFMMQGGDPEGMGTGGSGKNIKGEFAENGVNNTISHKRGVISMARSADPDSASSQFFIVHKDSEFLDGQYAAFGYVTEGMDVVDAVCESARPVDNNGTILPEDQPVIVSIRIESDGESSSSAGIDAGDPNASKEAMDSFEAFLGGNLNAEYKNGKTESINQTRDRIEAMYQGDFGDEAGKIQDVTYAFIKTQGRSYCPSQCPCKPA